MKASTTLLTGLLTIAAGAVLIICNKEISGKGIVTTAGIMFLVVGIINAVLYAGNNGSKNVTAKNQQQKSSPSFIARIFGIIVSSAAIILAISMFLFTDSFAKLIPALFGTITCIGVLIQVYILSVASRPVVMPVWTYAIPGIMFIIALILFTATLQEPTIMILTGVGLAIFGVGGFIESILLGSGRRNMEKATHNTADNHQVVDLKPTDVKEIKSLDD